MSEKKVEQNEEHQKALAEKDAKIADLEAMNESLTAKVEELSQAKNAPDQPKAPAPVKPFKVGKDEYVFTAGKFTDPRDSSKVLTAAEAATDKDLLAYLVEHNVGVIARKADVSK